ncbi:MAG: hypothetical protein J6Q99_03380 [Oscillospiraceae bacterium]|nr:hypothetical protein [Oscillospiraceae bacterium]
MIKSSNINLIDKLNKEKHLTKEEWVELISTYTMQEMEYAAELARKTALQRFGN